MPDGVKTDAVREMELYLRDMLRQVDSSLLEEWERMRDPTTGRWARAGAEMRPPRPEEPPDITRDTKAFTAAIRTRVFAFLRAWSIGDDEAALAVDRLARRRGTARPWTPERLRAAREAHRVEHARAPPRSRGAQPAPHPRRRRPTTGAPWRVQQMLVDPDGLNDWVAELEVDLAASREAGEPVLQLRRLGSLA